MKMIRKSSGRTLKFEYGLDGDRLHPWEGLKVPFGGAYCSVRPRSKTLEHVNEPADEEELFVCISGRAVAHIGDESFPLEKGDLAVMPAGVSHYIENDTDERFEFYALWWNHDTVAEFLGTAGHGNSNF